MADPEEPVILRQEMYRTKFDGESSIRVFITKILQCRDQLAQTPLAATDHESWHQARTIIMSRPEAEQTLTHVTKALIRYETDLQGEQKADKPTSNALFTATNHDDRNKIERDMVLPQGNMVMPQGRNGNATGSS
ncbi:MAG: hypothetical protein M1839_005699 [Geoglossum umbratile]|nr:MAG: hypothetical protein M1839_005699 [Geoglossum umbratile]